MTTYYFLFRSAKILTPLLSIERIEDETKQRQRANSNKTTTTNMPKTTVATKQSASASGANSKVGGKRSGDPSSKKTKGSSSSNKKSKNDSMTGTKEQLPKQPSKQPSKQASKQASKSTSKQPATTKPTAEQQRALAAIDLNSSNRPQPPAPPGANAQQETTLPPLSLEMSSAMDAADSEISAKGIAVSEMAYLNLVYSKWLPLRLLGGGRALTLFLAAKQGGGGYSDVMKWIKAGGKMMWQLIFLADYPRWKALRFLTTHVEESSDNGLLFVVDGGWTATMKLLGIDTSLVDGNLAKRFGGWFEHYDYSMSNGKFGGQVKLFHRGCHLSCDINQFKKGKLTKMPRPSPTTLTAVVATDFILPTPFTTSSKADQPTEVQIKAVVSHMATLNGDQLKALLATFNADKLAALLSYLGRTRETTSGFRTKKAMLKWVVDNTSIWHVVANKIANEVDIGGLNEFVTPYNDSKSKPYTEHQLTRISSLLTSMARTEHGRVQIETYMEKVKGTRLLQISIHNGLGTKAKSKDALKKGIKGHFFP